MKFIETEGDYFQDDREIITLEKCSNGGEYCREVISKINTYLVQSRNFFIDKDFVKAIEMKKLAFDETFNFSQDTCQGCGLTIRNHIYSSAKEMVSELEKMTRGWFGKKKFLAQLEVANIIFHEITERSR
jgi:hypothetical protein